MEAGAASENPDRKVLPSLMDLGQQPQNAAPSNSDGKANTEAIPSLMDLGKLPQTAASSSPDGKTKDETIPSLMEFEKPSQTTKSDKDDGKSTSESLPSLLDLNVTKQGSYGKNSKDKVEEDLKSVIYSRSLKIDLDNKMKRQLKYRNRQMKPRPPVNEEDKRFDFFKMDPEPFAALKFHVVNRAENYRDIQEQCRNQARFQYYFKLHNFSFARKHSAKKPLEHRKGKKFGCYVCDTFFKTEDELKEHLISNQHSENTSGGYFCQGQSKKHWEEIEMLYSALEDVASEMFLEQKVEGHIIDGSIKAMLAEGRPLDTSADRMRVTDPNFDKTIDDFTFKDIECKDKPLKDLLNVVYDRIMKPLWPDSNEIHGEKDSEENKSTEQDQENEKSVEESWCHYCRVDSGSKENIIEHRKTQEHFNFKTLICDLQKKAIAYWTKENVPEEEEKDKPDVRTEILAKFGITRKPPPESKGKKRKNKGKRGNPQRDSKSGNPNNNSQPGKRFRSSNPGPSKKQFQNQPGRGEPYHRSGYPEPQGFMNYGGPPGSFRPRPQFMQQQGPPGPYGPPGPPQHPPDPYGMPPRHRPPVRPYDMPPQHMNQGGWREYPPRGPPGPPRPMGPPPHMGPPRQKGPQKQKGKSNSEANKYLPNGKRNLPAWRRERNRLRLVKYMEAKNEKARKEAEEKLKRENEGK